MERYAVIGLGTFGRKVALTLTSKGAEVIAIDSDPTKVEEIKDSVALAVCLDSTDEQAMKAANIMDIDTAVVAVGENQQVAIVTTAILKRLGVGRIIARAMSPLYAQILQLVGAHKVVQIEEQMGEQIAKGLVAPDVHEHIVLSTGHSLVQVSPRREFIGKRLRDLNLRARYGVNVIAIHRKIPDLTPSGESTYRIVVNDLPGPDDAIGDNDIMVVVGTDEQIERMAKGE